MAETKLLSWCSTVLRRMAVPLEGSRERVDYEPLPLDEGDVGVEMPPKGQVVVYVGGERERVFLPVEHVNHPLFAELLQAAEEEYGFKLDGHGGIIVPCNASEFEEVMDRIASTSEVRMRRDSSSDEYGRVG